jgi:hypothetical protein
VSSTISRVYAVGTSPAFFSGIERSGNGVENMINGCQRVKGSSINSSSQYAERYTTLSEIDSAFQNGVINMVEAVLMANEIGIPAEIVKQIVRSEKELDMVNRKHAEQKEAWRRKKFGR